MTRSTVCWGAATAMTLAASARLVHAQTAHPTPTSMPTIAYADAAFGFEMRIPAGWDYDRGRFQPYKDAIGLLRGRAPGGRLGMQVLIFRIQPTMTEAHDDRAAQLRLPAFEDWVIDFGKAVADDAEALPEVKSPKPAKDQAAVLEWEPWKVPPRAGALLKYTSKLGAVTTQNLMLCVPLDPGTVWVLAFSAAVSGEEDRKQVRQAFDPIARSLRVYYDPGEAEQMTAALERGRALLDKLHAQAASVRLDDAEYYYDLRIAGKSIGYLRRRVSREEHVFSGAGAKHRDVREGIRVRERSWRFADDGTVRYLRTDMFSSLDGQNELIENQVTQLPAADVQQQPLVKTDQVIRKEGVLLASQTTNLDRALPDPGKPLSVGPVYLDLAWVRVLPGLLLTAPQEPHAVAVYNTETRAPILNTTTPLGERPLEGYSGPAYAFEVREGLIDKPAMAYTDAKGMLLRLVAGELVVSRTSKEEAERTWGARRDEAKKRFNVGED